jgi:hypothetical protein
MGDMDGFVRVGFGGLGFRNAGRNQTLHLAPEHHARSLASAVGPIVHVRKSEACRRSPHPRFTRVILGREADRRPQLERPVGSRLTAKR